jgi:cardiolipin synthase
MNGSLWTFAIGGADWLIRFAITLRVIMRRRPVGVSLAWISVIMAIPFAGAVVYLLFGELRLGRLRGERARALHGPYAAWLDQLHARYLDAESRLGDDDRTLARLITSGSNQPVIPGNALELVAGADPFFDRLVADLDAATQFCHLEFYIWSPGGRTGELNRALERAVGRGVVCRVLVDALGSRNFLRDGQADSLRHAGVEVQAALPVGLLRGLFRRLDLRLHRKIAVIDGVIGYTGSQNIADPRLFKKEAGVGEWVDAMVRVEGPAVEALAVTFLEDWEQETGVGLKGLTHAFATDIAAHGPSSVQVIPSGPNLPLDRMETLILQVIYDSRREIVMTTPYFVPSESMVEALRSAALRGVEVVLVVPAKIDSKLVGLASRAFQGDLAEAGVRIAQFEAGLLHTKSIAIDGERSLFGSVNLDPRSLQLNFEITLSAYDAAFTGRLRALQQTYIDRSVILDLRTWQARPFLVRLAENSARLLGPLI